ncbi:MAG: protein kinase [Planctomycetaceae bacterium]|jgi:serine/threonine protein kinase|nr:protein kinase [Planctomycetaceae bacterium]
MTQISADKVIELIEKSKLVDPEAFAAHREVLASESDPALLQDPIAVCKSFEDAGLLTRWQSEKILQGKYKGFFLGKHKLLGHIGSGGMSSVYLGEHMVLKHRRAVKVLPKSKLGKTSYLERFQREAKAIASLSHPNIVRAYDIDNEKDTHYIVMEYIEGVDLQILVKKHGPLPYPLVADYIAQAAHGLQHAHDQGLIHRDVKPANFLINTDGVIKVLDLGLALFQDQDDASLTMEYNDKVLGTADYLAPEQALNSHTVDNRADIYGLGCTMYFLLTGHPPFPDGSISSRIIKHQNTMPPDIRVNRPDCPGELDGICVKMMQKDAKFRYQECNQVAQALEAWLAKYKADNPGVAIKPSRGMTLDDLLEDAKSKGNYHSETVNNQLDDTKIESTKRTGQLGMALSSSDSGVLRAIVKSDSSAIDSQINLIHDSSQPNKPKSRSQAIQEASDRSRASSSSTPLIEPSASKSKTTNTVASKSGSTASPSTLGPKTPSATPKQPTSSSTKPSVPNTKSTSKPDEDSQEDQGLPLKSILIIIGVLAAIALVIAAVVFLKS